MPSYIILNLSFCCDIYLFCLKLESACLLSRAFYLQVCFFYLYVFEFCCQLAYGYVLMLIILHASALIVCLCMSLYYVLCIACFSRLQKKYQIFVIFLEVVTLTFDLQTSISIGFLLSPSGMCVPRFI